MKRRSFLNTLTQTLVLSLILTGLTTQAQPPDSPQEKIAGLKITGLDAFNGQYATIIYGINNNLLYNNLNSAFLTKIRNQTLPSVITNGEVRAPGLALQRSGIFEAYNAILVIVHMQSRLDWQNADNSIPEGATQGPNNDFKLVFNITKKDYQKAYIGQGMPDIVEIKFQQ